MPMSTGKSKSMKKKQRDKAKSFLKMKECRYCGSEENLTIDHKIPTRQGGTDELGNLQCLCKRCNSVKSGMSHKQVMSLFAWFKEIQRKKLFSKHYKRIISKSARSAADWRQSDSM